MIIYDITLSISPALPVFPGDPPVVVEPVSRISQGGAANVSCISCSSHCGTHIDPPCHLLDGGATVDQLPLELLIGPAVVVDVGSTMEIGDEQLRHLPIKGEKRVLLKTGALTDDPGTAAGWPHLTLDGAAYLRQAGVRLVGIDTLSIERHDGSGEVHRSLLSDGVVIVEGLKLDQVPAGHYELICLPLKLAQGDGAPVRAVLRGRGSGTPREGFDAHSSRWPLA